MASPAEGPNLESFIKISRFEKQSYFRNKTSTANNHEINLSTKPFLK